MLELDSFNHEISASSLIENVRTFSVDGISRLFCLKIKNIG